MEIRLMQISDYEEVYQLWHHTQGMALRNYDDSKEGISKFLKKNPSSNFVAVVNNKIIGVILCGMDGRRAYIYHTTVDENYRKKGIGSALLNAVYEAIQEAGIHKSGLLVLKNNEIGNQFWQKKGWDKRDDVTYYSINTATIKENQ